MTVILYHDYETRSEVDLKKHGLDRYSADKSTRVLMCSYAFNNDPVKLWTPDDGPFPRELAEAIEDPHVEKSAFNAQFERIIANRVLGLKTGYRNWRCTMALAYMQAFFGGLDQVGRQMELPEDKQKLAEGKRLIKMFCGPQRVTAKNPLRWRDAWTDPEDWELFGNYCIQDTESERSIKRRLSKFEIGPLEWEVYELDQLINDRGVPIDMNFVTNAQWMATRRKEELTVMLKRLTGLANPNSPKQLMGWLQDRGYPFSDMRKDTIKKVLADNAVEAKHEVEIIVESDDDDHELDALILPPAADGGFLDKEAVAAMKLRQQAARTSVKKFDALIAAVGDEDRLRFGFQYGGASRTLRWAGRRFQMQNLGRPPKEMSISKAAEAAGISEDYHLETVTNYIREGDYDGLAFYLDEPMNALAGTVRSSVRADDDEELLACDLSSIETCVIAWTSGCTRLLEVLNNKRDPYKDFGSRMYGVPYEDVVGKLRQDSKPAVLGCGFRLGGGEMREGKKTGLWAYAEALGVSMSQDEAHRAVKLFRETYPEIPKLWYALEDAVKKAYRNPGRKVRPLIRRADGTTFQVPVLFEHSKPYMKIILPSGRPLYYFKPRIEKVMMRGKPTRENPEGEPYEKENFSYMGKQQNGQAWVRIRSHGGKITENIVQAIARDILVVGLLRAHKDGFNIIAHVHDEILALIRKGSNYYTVERLRELMTAPIPWATGMPLGAAGWTAQFYRKD